MWVCLCVCVSVCERLQGTLHLSLKHHISTPVTAACNCTPSSRYPAGTINALRLHSLTLDQIVLCSPVFELLHLNLCWNGRMHCTATSPITCFRFFFFAVWIIYCLFLKCQFVWALMTRHVKPVNIFIAADWTQTPLSKMDSDYCFTDPLCTGFIITVLLSTWLPWWQEFCASWLCKDMYCMSSESSQQR